MKKTVLILLALSLALLSLVSCGSDKPFELYSNAQKTLTEQKSASIVANTKVTTTVDEIEHVSEQTTTYRYCNDDMSLSLSVKQDGNAGAELAYTYLNGTLYVDKGLYGNQKWQVPCQKDEVEESTGIYVDMSFATALPTLEAKDFDGVTPETDGKNTKITLSLTQDKIEHWLKAITGVAEMEASAETINMMLIFDQDGNLSKVHMRFQLMIDEQAAKVELTIDYADIGAQKPITLPADASTYPTLEN